VGSYQRVGFFVMQRPDYKTTSSSELMNQMISVQVITNGLNLSPLTTPISR